MKAFRSLKEIRQYYNKKNNTYEFIEDGELLDVEFLFKLDVRSHINALDINAWKITALNINAWNINAKDINAKDINALNITAKDITAKDINAVNINAWNINAERIDALDISYYAVCFAQETFKCKSVEGRRENAKHFCLDSEIVFVE